MLAKYHHAGGGDGLCADAGRYRMMLGAGLIGQPVRNRAAILGSLFGVFLERDQMSGDGGKCAGAAGEMRITSVDDGGGVIVGSRCKKQRIGL